MYLAEFDRLHWGGHWGSRVLAGGNRGKFSHNGHPLEEKIFLNLKNYYIYYSKQHILRYFILYFSLDKL